MDAEADGWCEDADATDVACCVADEVLEVGAAELEDTLAAGPPSFAADATMAVLTALSNLL